MSDPSPPDPESEPGSPEQQPSGRSPVARSVQRMGRLFDRARSLGRFRLPEPPLDLALLGRVLMHAALVGLGAGAVGVSFFAGLERIERWLLEGLAGYVALRAHGESHHEVTAGHFRPWLLLLIPAAGGLVSGLLTRLAPETRGGGGDAMLEAYHRHGGMVRPRVAPVKLLASLATLGSGGAGGREGPTMQIGAALGSWVASLLGVPPRERRILLVAGVAAGMSAVFRTPLGAALLAVEVLYRDDIESDPLVPAILASVVGYSVAVAFFGETTLFARNPGGYHFVARQLPLYGGLALVVSLAGALFVGSLERVKRLFRTIPGPEWARPAWGGLALGLFAVPVLVWVGQRVGIPGQGLGLLGGGYGAAQAAITGSPLLPDGWRGVELLLAFAVAKLFASALTIGSGGSAGDFAPSLVVGSVVGGAYGRAMQLLLGDPSIDPGAFALVGMGVLYGGIAHVPISALILVSELAGSYDLLVPFMLAQGIAMVVLRRVSLYPAQPARKEEVLAAAPPAPRPDLPPVRSAMLAAPLVAFTPATRLSTLIDDAAARPQPLYPVVDDAGQLVGLVTPELLAEVAGETSGLEWALAADVMLPPLSVRADDDVGRAAAAFQSWGSRVLLVVDADGRPVGTLDEVATARAYLSASWPRA